MSSTKNSWWRTNCIMLCLSVGLVACGEGVLADGDGDVYFTPWTVDAVQPQTVQDSMPELSAEDQQGVDELTREFSRQIEDFLGDSRVYEVLQAAERSFIMSGRFMELLELYRIQVEKNGTSTVAAPSLVWSYLLVGNEPAAERLMQRLITDEPDDALTWVVAAAFYLEKADESVDAARRSKEAFEQVLKIDPNFDGFQGMTAEAIQQQIGALEQRIGAAPAAAAVVDGTAAPMHSTDEGAGAAVAPVVEAEELEEEYIGEEAEEPEEDYIDEEAEELEEEYTDEEAEEFEEESIDEEPEQEDRGAARASHYIILGQQTLQSGGDNLQQAQNYFLQALELDAENVDAGIGILTIAQRTGAPEEMLTRQVDALSAHELTAQQAYDLGRFCLRNLNDRDRATSLLERVQQKDPSFARRVGVDSMLGE